MCGREGGGVRRRGAYRRRRRCLERVTNSQAIWPLPWGGLWEGGAALRRPHLKWAGGEISRSRGARERDFACCELHACDCELAWAYTPTPAQSASHPSRQLLSLNNKGEGGREPRPREFFFLLVGFSLYDSLSGKILYFITISIHLHLKSTVKCAVCVCGTLVASPVARTQVHQVTRTIGVPSNK